ncbi:MAG: arsenite methyltransferase [Armatimonadota bacterium]
MSTDPVSTLDAETIRTAVRERYKRAALHGTSCCEPADGASHTDSCCGDATAHADACCADTPVTFADGQTLPEDIATGSLGCGAPIDAAALQPGETVVDLGSGAGLDVFLAADRVGPTGRAIGVDMTPEMIARARTNAGRLGVANVEFRLGEIERLPLADESADVIISNCVINLLPDKRPAFAEAHRVLKPGGRLVVSDIVSAGPVPDTLKTVQGWTACLAGAIPVHEYLEIVAQAGFEQVEVTSSRNYHAAGLISATVRAAKPRVR